MNRLLIFDGDVMFNMTFNISSPVENKHDRLKKDVPEAGKNLLPAYFPISNQLTFCTFYVVE